LRFILYYRIIEYAAFTFIDEKVWLDLKKIIAAPDLISHLNQAIENIVTTISSSKIDDVPRFNQLMVQTVDPKIIWREVEKNAAFFRGKTSFDGGFVIDALVTSADTETTFCGSGIIKFCNAIRKLRNTLSHGKDQESAGVITPTTRNFRMMEPWVHLMATAAGEVMLFKEF
jgi:hypothetical protein